MQEEDDDWIAKHTEGYWPVHEHLTSTEDLERKRRLDECISVDAEAAESSVVTGSVVRILRVFSYELTT